MFAYYRVHKVSILARRQDEQRRAAPLHSAMRCDAMPYHANWRGFAKFAFQFNSRRRTHPFYMPPPRSQLPAPTPCCLPCSNSSALFFQLCFKCDSVLRSTARQNVHVLQRPQAISPFSPRRRKRMSRWWKVLTQLGCVQKELFSGLNAWKCKK